MNNSDPTPFPPAITVKQSERSGDLNKDSLGDFLSFLDSDIEAHPERLIAFDPTLVARVHSLVGDIEVNINESLSTDDE